MTWIKENFPLLLSAQFWGIVATATFALAMREGWLNESFAEWLRNIAGAATLVGFTRKTVKQARSLPAPVADEEALK